MLLKQILSVVIILFTTSAFAEEEFPPRWESGPFHMFENWSTTDRTLFGSFTALNVIDILQTRYIFEHDDEYEELNPILSPLGKDGATAFMVVVNVGLYYLLDVLPENRTTSLGVMNFMKIAVVGRNFQIGVGLEF